MAGAGRMTAAIVLAAGRSERMGRPKAFLTFPNGETFLARTLRELREGGADDIVVITNPETDENIRAASQFVRHAVNEHSEEGMISSIMIGVEALERPPRVIVTLVDIPEIRSEIVQKLAETPVPDDVYIVVTTYADGHGHPIMLMDPVYPLLSKDLPRGLKSLIDAHPDRVMEISCDGGQPWDFDTPDDYARVTR